MPAGYPPLLLEYDGEFMPDWVVRYALLVCLSCSTAVSHARNDAPIVLKNKQQLEAILASGTPTALDALTPHGKRQLLDSFRWGRVGIGGFSTGALIRELNATQLAAALAFLDSETLTPHLAGKLIGPPVRLPAPSSRLVQNAQRMERLADDLLEQRPAATMATSNTSQHELTQHYIGTYGRSMIPASLRRHPIGDLPLLFDAALLASSRDPSSAATEHLQLVHKELVRRGVNTRRQFDDTVLSALLSAREFDKARIFARQRPHLAGRPVPAIVDTLGASYKGRTVYELDSSGKVLTRRKAEIDAGLLMTVGEGCHFSRDALDAIRSDPALQARLQQEGLMLIVSPRSPILLSYIAEWNRANPMLPIRVPVNVEEWREIADAATPEFFLYRGGKVAGHLIGWPEGGQVAELQKLLDTPYKD